MSNYRQFFYGCLAVNINVRAKYKEVTSRLRQMGRGSSSILQAQASAVAAIEFKYGYSVSSSDQTIVCENKEAVMRRQCSVTIKSGETRISITARFKFILGYIFAAALLVFGYGDGFSPSALAYST